MKRYRLMICIASTFLILTSCGQEESHRETVEKPDKKITVLDQVDKDGKIEVKDVQDINGVRAFQFLNENTMIVSKENKQFRSHDFGPKEVYAQNLATYNLKNKSTFVLHPNNEIQHAAKLSPNGEYLFYKVAKGEDPFGYIMNLQTKKTVKIKNVLLYPSSGEWLNNSEVMFITMEGKLSKANVKGEVEPLLHRDDRILDAVKGIGGIYYIGVNNQLFFLHNEQTDPEKIRDNVVSIIPSPNGKQLALVQQKDAQTRTLSITDLKGSEAFQLALSTQIFGVSWSPDGSKLAYNFISEKEGDKGIFIADGLTGDVTHLNVNLDYAADQLDWSQSGNKLVASSFTQNQVHTYVIFLK
ncbi:TolB family protein [Priestia megaterium]|uniref:TolB family protein n=1 Tax=Priestia megaterium TaxID=1404 RepID=UPI00406BA5C4